MVTYVLLEIGSRKIRATLSSESRRPRELLTPLSLTTSTSPYCTCQVPCICKSSAALLGSPSQEECTLCCVDVLRHLLFQVFALDSATSFGLILIFNGSESPIFRGTMHRASTLVGFAEYREVSSAVCCAVSCGLQSAIVVDAGWVDTRVTAVLHGTMRACVHVPFGTRDALMCLLILLGLHASKQGGDEAVSRVAAAAAAASEADLLSALSVSVDRGLSWYLSQADMPPNPIVDITLGGISLECPIAPWPLVMLRGGAAGALWTPGLTLADAVRAGAAGEPAPVPVVADGKPHWWSPLPYVPSFSEKAYCAVGLFGHSDESMLTLQACSGGSSERPHLPNELCLATALWHLLLKLPISDRPLVTHCVFSGGLVSLVPQLPAAIAAHMVACGPAVGTGEDTQFQSLRPPVGPDLLSSVGAVVWARSLAESSPSASRHQHPTPCRKWVQSEGSGWTYVEPS